jgi:hypothetical protein
MLGIMNDRQFEERFNQIIGPMVDDWFYSKVAGVTHANRDGSNRADLLARSTPFDFLDLIPEPENPVDPNAVAVYLQGTSDQVGYLPERTAHDLLPKMAAEDGKWFATIRELSRDPETGCVVGANIVVFRMVKALIDARQK